MSVQRLHSHYGFTCMPFGRNLASGMRTGTAGWAKRSPVSAGVDQHALGVITGEAHLLDNQQREARRVVSNHDMDSGSPFAALLVGQPTLGHRLRLGGARCPGRTGSPCVTPRPG